MGILTVVLGPGARVPTRTLLLQVPGRCGASAAADGGAGAAPTSTRPRSASDPRSELSEPESVAADPFVAGCAVGRRRPLRMKAVAATAR